MCPPEHALESGTRNFHQYRYRCTVAKLGGEGTIGGGEIIRDSVMNTMTHAKGGLNQERVQRDKSSKHTNNHTQHSPSLAASLEHQKQTENKSLKSGDIRSFLKVVNKDVTSNLLGTCRHLPHTA